jgi:hypothetical protein
VQSPGEDGSEIDDEAEIDNKTAIDSRVEKWLQNELLIESEWAGCAWGNERRG